MSTLRTASQPYRAHTVTSMARLTTQPRCLLQLATPELAAVRIQAAARGWLARRQVARSTAEEDAFLGVSATVRAACSRTA